MRYIVLEGFKIYNDMTNQGLSAILMQYGKVVGDASHPLKDDKTRHPTHIMELVVVVIGL